MCTAVKGICAAMRVCPLREINIYIKISLRRSAAIKQICTAMRRSAAIREVCAAMRVCSFCEIIIYIKISLRRIAAIKQICAAIKQICPAVIKHCNGFLSNYIYFLYK